MALNDINAKEEDRRRSKFLADLNSNILPGVNNPVIDKQNFVTKDTPIQINTQLAPSSEPKIPRLYDIPAAKPTAAGGNWLKNESTGEVFTIDSSGSINGGPVPKRNKGIMGGYNLDGSRIIPSGKQGDQDALRGNDFRALQKLQFMERQGYEKPNEALKYLLKPGDIPGMSKRALREYNNRLLEANSPLVEVQREKNRIDELNVLNQNKLRDIQGEVAKEPPVKENALKPMVVKVPDGLGGTKEEIFVPNAEGKYVSGMADQATSTNIGTTFTPEQRAKAVAYAKANPNIDKKVILQKIISGEI